VRPIDNGSASGRLTKWRGRREGRYSMRYANNQKDYYAEDDFTFG
jgi:hypothetical protein